MANREEPWGAGERSEPVDDGTTPGLRAIRAALPTSRHAEMLFDMVRERLGAGALVETADGGKQRVLYRRAGKDGVIPWPLLRHVVGGRFGIVVPLTGPEGQEWTGPPGRPGEAPKLRGLRPGNVLLYDGPHEIAILYGDDGRWVETSRSEDPAAHEGAVAVLAGKSAAPTELLADYVVGLDLGRHGPGRIHYAVPLPGGVECVWNVGLFAIRDAVFDAKAPVAARCVVADGYAGTALGWGATRDEALSGWRREVDRDQPKPPKPKEPKRPPGADVLEHDPIEGSFGMTMAIRGPTSDVPAPEPAPENTPAVLLPLPPFPRKPPPFGAWVRLLGPRGTTVFAARREDPEGFTLVGERALEIVNFDVVDAAIDAHEVEAEPMRAALQVPREGLPPYTFAVSVYRVVDERTHLAVETSFAEGQSGPQFQARSLDGERLRWKVLRFRRLAE